MCLELLLVLRSSAAAAVGCGEGGRCKAATAAVEVFIVPKDEEEGSLVCVPLKASLNCDCEMNEGMGWDM